MKHRKASRVNRKHTYGGDSGKSMGLSTNGTISKQLGFGTIGRVLYPLSAPRTSRRTLSLAVRSAVAEMKK